MYNNIPERNDTVVTLANKNLLGQLGVNKITSNDKIKVLTGQNPKVKLASVVSNQIIFGIGNVSFETYQDSETGLVSGIHFVSSLSLGTNNAGFNSCVFDKQIDIQAGKYTFTNCLFRGNVVNAGTLADVTLIGCMFDPGASGTNVTEIGSI